MKLSGLVFVFLTVFFIQVKSFPEEFISGARTGMLMDLKQKSLTDYECEEPSLG